ncbi:hypothetical protein Cni_G02757 [Canna indica]|uniref:Endonuclease/exonuclease/phosphatase domain-containing protein n=1 Tax=Canna indica TaxID=4628 RepID=A0AAQ3JTB1_9LILI|nr:hypothetical protein Cni_G02757 [Canna indica]
MAWKNHLSITIISSSSYYIQAHILHRDNFPSWKFIGLHLHYEVSTRHKQFQQLTNILRNRSCPILIGGDFNSILRHEEKSGGASFSSHMTEDLLHFTSSGCLLEFPTSGPPFTWSNKRPHPNLIEKVLDKFLTSADWHDTWCNWLSIHLEVIGSDHQPILLRSMAYTKAKAGFKFDKCWLTNTTIASLVEATWNVSHCGSPQFCIHCKLKAIRLAILNWLKVNKLNSRSRVDTLQMQLLSLSSQHDENSFHQRKEVKQELRKAIAEEEIFRRQKSHVKWLHEGDRNTSYFHACTHSRRCTNTIPRLKNCSGLWCEGQDAVADIAQQYFQTIFATSNPAINDLHFLSSCRKVSRRMNRWLLRLVSIEETKLAVFSLNPDSAPGPDGFTGHFFRHNWQMIGAEITEAATSFFRSTKLLKSFNHSFIALIPKTKTPQDMSQLRPISLSNFLYKVFSKIMVHRLQPLMDALISNNQ